MSNACQVSLKICPITPWDKWGISFSEDLYALFKTKGLGQGNPRHIELNCGKGVCNGLILMALESYN